MSAILNSLNAHNFLIRQPILMILVSKFIVYRAFSDKTHLLLGLRSPLSHFSQPHKISQFMNCRKFQKQAFFVELAMLCIFKLAMRTKPLFCFGF